MSSEFKFAPREQQRRRRRRWLSGRSHGKIRRQEFNEQASSFTSEKRLYFLIFSHSSSSSNSSLAKEVLRCWAATDFDSCGNLLLRVCAARPSNKVSSSRQQPVWASRKNLQPALPLPRLCAAVLKVRASQPACLAGQPYLSEGARRGNARDSRREATQLNRFSTLRWQRERKNFSFVP